MTPSKTRSDRVAPLAAAFAKSDLTRLSISDGEFSLELIRRVVPPESMTTPAPATVDASIRSVGATAPATTNARETIRAELVGILRYVDPRAAVGVQIEREREVFAIEALGVRTPVMAGGKGLIVELFVNDGSPVEYGQPLMVIERV